MWQYLKRDKFCNFWRLLLEISETFSMIQIAQLRSELKLYYTAATIPPQYQAGVGSDATIKTRVEHNTRSTPASTASDTGEDSDQMNI